MDEAWAWLSHAGAGPATPTQFTDTTPRTTFEDTTARTQFTDTTPRTMFEETS